MSAGPVGSVILLRFEYVTDQSYNGHGFAVKDVRIPQAGIDEPGAAERGWISEGWVHVDAPMKSLGSIGTAINSLMKRGSFGSMRTVLRASVSG